jgi:KaiC/GvpD/RAD55 family RecA-like ATPase
MKVIKSRIQVSREDRDWLLELGREQGDSRVMTSRNPVPQGLLTQFRPPGSEGLTLPWPETHECVRFRPGKVTVWSGPTFSGKTAMLRHLVLHELAHQEKALICSFEDTPEETWRELICTACLTRHPTRAQIEWCLDLWDERLFVFDSTELIDPTLLCGIIRYVSDTYGIAHVVIDSLMRLNLRVDDIDGQREMGNMLGRLARLCVAHLYLVVHPRKTLNSRSDMDLYDIRGGQDIVAQADVVVTQERRHEEDYDTLLTIWKQRGDINWIGRIQLWYHKNSRQLLYRPFHAPIKYLPEQAYDGVIP